MSEEIGSNRDSVQSLTAAVGDVSLNPQTSCSKSGESKDKAKSKKGMHDND